MIDFVTATVRADSDILVDGSTAGFTPKLPRIVNVSKICPMQSVLTIRLLLSSHTIKRNYLRIRARTIRIRWMRSHECVRPVVLDLDDLAGSVRFDVLLDRCVKGFDTLFNVRQNGVQFGKLERIDPGNQRIGKGSRWCRVLVRVAHIPKQIAKR